MKTLIQTFVAAVGMSSMVSAASIAINFSHNATDIITGTDVVGPTEILGDNWNNTTVKGTGPIAAANVALVDDSGSSITTTLTYSAANTFNTNAGVGNNNKALTYGYLDDGGAGASVTLSNITFASYDVYVIMASDAGNTAAGGIYTSGDVKVNGVDVIGSQFDAIGHFEFGTAPADTTGDWIESTSSTAGNYVLARDQSAANLTVIPNDVDGARVGIAGIVVVDTTIPEPSSTALLGLGGLALILRRRK